MITTGIDASIERLQKTSVKNYDHSSLEIKPMKGRENEYIAQVHSDGHDDVYFKIETEERGNSVTDAYIYWSNSEGSTLRDSPVIITKVMNEEKMINELRTGLVDSVYNSRSDMNYFSMPESKMNTLRAFSVDKNSYIAEDKEKKDIDIADE